MKKTLHWTERKSKRKPSSYQQTIGKLHLRETFIQALFGDLQRALEKGQKSYAKFIESDLRALGVGDYTPADEGMAPKGY